MNMVHLETKQRTILSPLQEPQSYLFFQSPPPPLQPSKPDAFDFATNINPSVLLILIILAIIFFLSGLLHILVRFLLSPPNGLQDEMDSTTALQGQLQQLFHLHDEGVDQSFIDTLPVFSYKEIIGVKDPFDCAVCLCEFESEDKLRLLPKCSHAFHMDCIDTWLLSHSTCPICRAFLVNDFVQDAHDCSPVVLVLESGRRGESSREIGLETTRVDSSLNTRCDEVEMFDANQVQKTCEKMERVVKVKLGKFKNLDGVVEENDVDSRRCFSMGSFAYVMDDNTSLQVPIRTPMKQKSTKKPSLPLKPGCKLAMSECGGDSRRDFNGFDEFKVFETQSGSKSIGTSKRGSFSGSKNWLRGRNEPSRGLAESSRRVFSFQALLDETKDKDSVVNSGRTASEFDVSRWGDEASEYGLDIERTQSFNSLDCDAKSPSFARKTLSWLMGSRPNKVVHSNDPSNIV